MKPNQNPPSAPPRAVACDVAAHGRVHIPLESIPDLRRQPGPVSGIQLPVNTLKQADEQTVAAVSAVLHAIHQQGMDPAGFQNWGVLAAPHYLGRAALAAALYRFREEGAWGVSPHLAPHRSLHSPSGAISHALKIRGPNFGIGGGPRCAAEALLAAAAMLGGGRVPGLWVVFSTFDPDQPPDREGRPAPGTNSAALALALTPPRSDWTGLRLRVAAGAEVAAGGRSSPSPALDLFRLQSILDTVARNEPGEPLGHPLEAGGWMEMEKVGTSGRVVRMTGSRQTADLFLPSPLCPAETDR